MPAATASNIAATFDRTRVDITRPAHAPAMLSTNVFDVFAEWIARHDDHAIVADELDAAAFNDELNEFTDSLHGQLCRKGFLSDRQVDAFMRGRARRAAQPDRPAPSAAAVEEGVYERDDIVYVVKRARESGNLYAKRIVEIGGERLTEAGSVINAEFEYAPGAIYNLGPEHKMDLDRAKALTIRYGFCIACGRHLKAAQSVEQGIGPVCRTKFA